MIENISFSISCFLGKARGGKTGSMVEWAEQILQKIELTIKELENKPKLNEIEKKRLNKFKKFETWSNLELNKNIFKKYKKITLNEIMEMYKNKISIKYKLLIIDDLFKNLDSRLSLTDTNRCLSYFITEVGKSSNILLYVSHFRHRVDLRLREMTENFIWCKKGKLYNIKLDNFLIKNVWIEDFDYYKLENEKKELNKMIIKQIFLKEYINFEDNYGEIEKKEKKVRYIKGTDFFDLYNTEEVI